MPLGHGLEKEELLKAMRKQWGKKLFTLNEKQKPQIRFSHQQ